ncbi:MAG: alanine--tRNA ligase [Bacteroidales bacterium]|nr:alanine--tRNA ligase [Bacteroidales bacterium]
MNSKIVRQKFLDFFSSKAHTIVSSAPMVVKGDPTLMFTNAGMNQFKDIFLGNAPAVNKRIANTQKCLRVSGKHNDLEEVGHDTYHHTMFEMLGNWSFGDYFKKEAIAWAWEFLVEEMKISKDQIYATVFEGSNEDKLEKDNEAFEYWKKFLDEDRILAFSKKDNFWEMGDTGPCGPCSEIHVDLRSLEERKKTDGKNLVNKDHPLVIEIWNLVFIQYNRKANGDLEVLSQKHVDTGMGFERLCMVMQGKTSNYDTDIFLPLIYTISEKSGIPYGKIPEADTAMRVVADHLRAVAFAIADGQLPSNAKAGYVIRRILRRAIRYYYTFLDQKEPFIYLLLPALIQNMGDAFPELKSQQQLIEKVIKDEELSFLKTLDSGIRLLDAIITDAQHNKLEIVSGKKAFELYDTFGFPLDLTQLILREHKLSVDLNEFDREMLAQKTRSRKASEIETEDWIILFDDAIQEFIGYHYLKSDIKITRYRKITIQGKTHYQLVFNFTPFYGESGGQVGDTGYIDNGKERIPIIDTKKENNLIIHITEKLPVDLQAPFHAVVDSITRQSIANNHTATHLLHNALRKVLGNHVEQKGSLVHADYLRFDFSHFQKITDDELRSIEQLVNRKIRENEPLEEFTEVPVSKANEMGAMALFGEKYGDTVRIIKFGESVELCGGTHVQSTGNIGYFKIISETSIAAGIRRIQAYTGEKAEEYINTHLGILSDIEKILDSPGDLRQSILALSEQNSELRKKVEKAAQQEISRIKNNLKGNVRKVNGINYISEKISAEIPELVKDLAYQLRNEIDNLFLVVGADIHEKAHLTVMISDNLVKEKNFNAGSIIRELAKEINGGGGGQAFYATAGGKNTEGIERALQKAEEYIL